MRVTTTKSKNAESFYITKSFVNDAGKSTSKIIRKLGTLSELSEKLGADRDGVMAWAREQAAIETAKYEKENESKVVLIPFHANRELDYHKQKFFEGGYLFLQSIYYGLKLDNTCRKIKAKYKFQYDLNAILSDLIYTRILEPASKYSSYQAAQKFLEPPSYEIQDMYRALSVLPAKVTLFRRKHIRTAVLLERETTVSFIMTARTTILKSNRRMAIRNTGKARSIGPIPSYKWDCLPTETGSPSLFHFSLGTKTSRSP